VSRNIHEIGAINRISDYQFNYFHFKTDKMAEENTAKSITVRDVNPTDFIAAYAEVLKNNDKFVVPKWADLVKTGVAKELAPYDPDWYFVRAGKSPFTRVVVIVLDFYLFKRTFRAQSY
jgi:hypothetical protein